MNTNNNVVLISLYLIFFIPVSIGSTIKQIDIDHMLDSSELVFEGKVISSEAKWDINKTRIYTYVTFSVQEIIKGNHSQTSLTLKFSGGTVDGMTLEIASLVYPKLNEEGIYFIESVDGGLVNPIMGWSQGHFIVEKNLHGKSIVKTLGNRSVVGFDNTISSQNKSTKHTHREQEGHQHPSEIEFHSNVFSNGVVSGITISSEQSQAMDKDSFKAALKKKLNNK